MAICIHSQVVLVWLLIEKTEISISDVSIAEHAILHPHSFSIPQKMTVTSVTARGIPGVPIVVESVVDRRVHGHRLIKLVSSIV